MDMLSPLKNIYTRGITVKECNEKLSELSNENLKLKMQISMLQDDMDHMMKAHQAEVESLTEEISDIQRLLCLASKAMGLMKKQYEENLKEIRQENDSEKRTLQLRIQELESALKEQENKLKDPQFFKLKDSASSVTDAFGLDTTTTCTDRQLVKE